MIMKMPIFRGRKTNVLDDNQDERENQFAAMVAEMNTYIKTYIITHFSS